MWPKSPPPGATTSKDGHKHRELRYFQVSTGPAEDSMGKGKGGGSYQKWEVGDNLSGEGTLAPRPG